MASGPSGQWHDRVRAIAVMLEAAGYQIRFTRDVRHLWAEPPPGTKRRKVHVELEAPLEDLDNALQKIRRAIKEDS